jgi:hypothetical protein
MIHLMLALLHYLVCNHRITPLALCFLHFQLAPSSEEIYFLSTAAKKKNPYVWGTQYATNETQQEPG